MKAHWLAFIVIICLIIGFFVQDLALKISLNQEHMAVNIEQYQPPDWGIPVKSFGSGTR